MISLVFLLVLLVLLVLIFLNTSLRENFNISEKEVDRTIKSVKKYTKDVLKNVQNMIGLLINKID